MSDPKFPVALNAIDVPPRPKGTIYPSHLAGRVEGRIKAPLGNVFGLNNFGVNLTRLQPGAQSALRHAHSKQDEFVYILEGCPVLITDEGRTPLTPGMCAGFVANSRRGHHLINEFGADVLYLEIGDRSPGDDAFYPDDDIHAFAGPDGKWIVTRKDGTSF